MKRYMLIGGIQFQSYSGTTTITGLRIVGHADTADEAKVLTDDNFDDCGGVMLWIDLHTGQPGEPGLS